MTHIGTKSTTIWLRYDPKCNLTICKECGHDQYKPRKQLTSAKLSKESISGVYLDIGPLKNSNKERFLKSGGVTETDFLLL